jgi:DNA polymerase-3 subunit epsilon
MAWDTETTGLPLFTKPSDDPAQPHLVQLAMIMCDAAGRENAVINVLIKPEGWTISDDVAAIHGVTQQRALEFGISESEAVDLYLRFARQADLQIAHNRSFDTRIMRIAMLRQGMTREDCEQIEARPGYCTASGLTAHVNLPPTEKMRAAGRMHPKTPNLTECVKHFLGEDFKDAHDGIADARMCARVFFEAQRRGIAMW